MPIKHMTESKSSARLKRILEPKPPPPVGPFFDNDVAAAFLGLKPRTLEKLRLEGRGPAFYALGRRRMYTKEDLLEWAMARRRTSTSGTAA